MNVTQLKMEYPDLKTVVAVSKTRTVDEIKQLMSEGFHDFGENKAQELYEKAPHIKGAVWHFIGHLQTNKVKDVIAIAATIHSVDSLKLLRTIEQEAAKIKKEITILMQVNLAEEETKFGMDRNEIPAFLQAAQKCTYTKLIGIMVIGPNTEDQSKIQAVFHEAKEMQVAIQKNIPAFQECSMGMSHDYLIALQEGATLLRIGTLLFGER